MIHQKVFSRWLAGGLFHPISHLSRDFIPIEMKKKNVNKKNTDKKLRLLYEQSWWEKANRPYDQLEKIQLQVNSLPLRTNEEQTRN